VRTLQLGYFLMFGLSLNLCIAHKALAEELPAVVSDIDIVSGFEFGNGGSTNKNFVPGIVYQSVAVADLIVTDSPRMQNTLPPGWNSGTWGNQPVIYRWFSKTSQQMEVVLKRTQNEFWRYILAGVQEVKRPYHYKKYSGNMSSSDG